MEFNEDDEILLEEFCLVRNIKAKTKQGYKTALEKYMGIINMHLEDILEEAETDEENINSLKKRRIKKHLLKYRMRLVEEYTSGYTIRTYFNKVKTFYRHNEIQLPYIPPLKLDKEYEMNFGDLPTHEELQYICENYSLTVSAIVLFMSSSGQAMAETLSLTVKQFIDGIKEYTSKTDVYEILDDLEARDDIIPTFYMKRLKTGKFYFTFCSPEATREIIRYLKYERVDFDLEDKLFDVTTNKLTNTFQNINDSNNWGRVGKYRKFRTHTIRKFNASNIGMQPEDVDKIQGRSRSILHETYIKVNPNSLKRTYRECVGNVMLGLDEAYFNVDKVMQKYEEDKMLHIYKVGNRFKVMKTRYNKQVTFGVYSHLIYAIRARDELAKVRFNVDRLSDDARVVVDTGRLDL